MSDKEIQELKERVYAISYSGFPLDTFFNDIRNVSEPRFNEMAAYRDLKLIVDKIYDLREKAKKYKDKETPKKPIILGLSVAIHTCPVCDKELIVTNDEIVIYKTKTNYCDNCGQRLDWSENNE